MKRLSWLIPLAVIFWWGMQVGLADAQVATQANITMSTTVSGGGGGTVTGTGVAGQGTFWSGVSAISGDTGFLYGGAGAVTFGAGAGSMTLNTAGGTNAVFTEAGISKTSGATETFALTNPGAGVANFSADGDVSGATLTGTGLTTGSVLFSGAAGLVSQDNANLFWDDTNNQLLLGAGTAALPALSTVGDPDTGFYHPSANIVAATAGGVEYSRWAASVFGSGVDGMGISGASANNGIQIINTGGGFARVDVGRPDLGTLYGDVLYDPAGGGFLNLDASGASAGLKVRTGVGAGVGHISLQTKLVERVQIAGALGTAALPTLTLDVDPNTGFWHPAADTLAVSTNGVENMRWASTSALTSVTGSITTTVDTKSATYSTATNCADSAGAAACGSAAAGAVVVDATATTVVVSTTAVKTTSRIMLQFDSSLGAELGITCNTTVALPTVTARTAATSFTITVPVAPVTNPACYTYWIVN